MGHGCGKFGNPLKVIDKNLPITVIRGETRARVPLSAHQAIPPIELGA